MRKKVTRGEFRKIGAEEILCRLGNLGFTEYYAGAFGRRREGFIQGVGLSPDASMMKFCVSVGFVIPALWDKTDFILGSHTTRFEISHRLGEFRDNLTGLEIWYHFYTEAELRACFGRVYADFQEQALPWLERFPTLTDVAGEYYRYRIGPLAEGEKRPADPFAWAMYGWMLDLIGQPDNARVWLTRAREHIAEQGLAKDGGGAWYSNEQQRLEELLRHSL